MPKVAAKSLHVFVLLCLALSYTPRAFPQTSTTGALRGQIHEAGASKGIGKATVVVTNEENGLSRSVEADDNGNFFLATLPSALYTINVTAPGYESQVISDFAVRISKANDLDVPLKQGTVNQSVTVQAAYEGATLTKSSQVIGGFTTRQVAELPSNIAGTGVDTLALLLPGVTAAFGLVNSNGTPLSVNGNRVVSNNFNIDGQDNNDQFLGGQVFFVDNQDIVADYQIITNSPLAQFGRNQGAIINIVTKSGTNDLHGTGFWFHRDRRLFDSMTNFERRSGLDDDPAPLLYNVIGGTIGGHLVKDRVFFFGSYQGVTTRETLTTRSFLTSLPISEGARLKSDFPGNPAIAALADFSGFALNDFGSVRIDTSRNPISFRVGAKQYSAFFTERTFPFSSETPYSQNELSLRSDAKASAKDNVWFRYLFQDATFKNFLAQFGGAPIAQAGKKFDQQKPSDRPGGGAGRAGGLSLALTGGSDGFTGDLRNRSHYFGGNWNRQLSAHAINDFNFSYSTTLISFGGGCSGLKGCIPSSENIDSGLAFVRLVGPVLGVGPDGHLPFGHTSGVTQVRDNYSVVRGTHQIIAGVDIRKQNVTVGGLTNSNGRFFFNEFINNPNGTVSDGSNSLVKNVADSFQFGVGADTVRYNEVDQSYFFQDDWKVRENLTLDLGIRYEYIGQPFNKLHDLTVDRETSGSFALWKQSVPLDARTVGHLDPDRNNFAPRVGFAYTPRFWSKLLGQDTTVIRGGYSIAYDPPTYIFARDVANSAPTSLIYSASAPFTIGVPDAVPAGAKVRVAASGSIPRNVIDPRDFSRVVLPSNFHSPYAQQWSLGVQRKIGKNNLVEIRYLGSHAVGLFQPIDRNPYVSGLANGGSRDFCTDFDCKSIKRVDFPSFPKLLPQGVKPDPTTGYLLPNRGSVESIENTGQSVYHGLQSRYSGRLFNQLAIGSSYTFSKALDNVSEVRSLLEQFFVSAFQYPQDPFDVNKGERSYSGLDRRHVFSLNGTWDIPFFKEQRGILGRVLGGWQINNIYLLSSGLRYTPETFADGFYSLRPLRAINANLNADPRTVGITDIDMALFFTGLLQQSPTGFYSMNQFNKTRELVPVALKDVRFILPGPGSAKTFGTPFGDVARNSLVGPRTNVLNTGFFKTTRLGERMSIQFRTEIFNLLNHPNPGYGFIFSGRGTRDSRARPNSILDDAGVSPEIGTPFNDKTEMEYGRRVIQFGLRLTF
jgi:hypothetical protein